ncbi:metal-dependent transcriptional regulator [Rarobacter faecitabidus]|uniref:Manganese transport regulator n=1 Tax=Rarobacter faecitabidus TaxID=13243 RepID=A0A542ZWQ5_RARFA|nr:metal-dependent transcriptional regulator [Rarobacter faecitabidus]TQL64794.1 DtxR family iron (metal) dependent repressor [Rarobacter faecitabidus]
MSVSDLSASTQNYLKVIWGLAEWSDDPVTPKLIADKSGLKMSSVSDAIKKLDSQGLVEHAPYGAVELTELGRRYAIQMVRRHRLIESFLVTTLGYTWDQVHDEAETLEHAVSDFMVERIDALLGYPDRDPHGDPIPDAEGIVRVPDAVRLSQAGPVGRVVVERISDEDPAMLQFFDSCGIGLGAELTIGEAAPYSDAVQVSLPGGGKIPLGAQAADAIFVSPAPAAEDA